MSSHSEMRRSDESDITSASKAERCFGPTTTTTACVRISLSLRGESSNVYCTILKFLFVQIILCFADSACSARSAFSSNLEWRLKESADLCNIFFVHLALIHCLIFLHVYLFCNFILVLSRCANKAQNNELVAASVATKLPFFLAQK